MPDRRSCRACGCWELRACEGGCSWIAADRCSACPDAPLTLPINVEHLRASKFDLQMHMNLGGGRHSYVRQSIDYPQLVVSRQTKRGQVLEQHLFVGALEVPWGDLEQAVELLNARAVAA